MGSLLQKAKEGDRGAVESIINQFTHFILKESSKYYIKGFEYEDLVQHGYLSVIKAIHQYKDPKKNFNAYCIMAIKLNFKALLKKEIKHFREFENENISEISNTNYKFTVEDEVIAYEIVKSVYRALDMLSKEEREIIEKFYFKENSLNEIAIATNRTSNNLIYKKRRIIKKLQSILKSHI